jgi:quinol monooxygenase YgiN
MDQVYAGGPAAYRPDPDMITGPGLVRIWPDEVHPTRGCWTSQHHHRNEGSTMLVKVFPIKLKDGMQDKVEAVVREFAPQGPGTEEGTLSFRVYREPAKPDHLLFVEHFADQAAYDAHTSSPAYRDLIAGQFAGMIVEFTELDHELVVAV